MSSWSGWSAASDGLLRRAYDIVLSVATSLVIRFARDPGLPSRQKGFHLVVKPKLESVAPTPKTLNPTLSLPLLNMSDAAAMNAEESLLEAPGPNQVCHDSPLKFSVGMSTTAVSTMATITIAIIVTVPVTYDSITILLLSVFMSLDYLFIWLTVFRAEDPAMHVPGSSGRLLRHRGDHEKWDLPQKGWCPSLPPRASIEAARAGSRIAGAHPPPK